MKTKMKQLATFLLLFSVIVSFAAAPVLAATRRFNDVSRSKWYYDYVENLAAKGIINGYPNGDFKPNNRVERQHVCVMVAKAAGLSSQGKRANFPDVPRNSETSSFIAALQVKGAIGGYPDGTFKPRRSVTRAEIAAIIAKGFDIKSAGTAGGLKDIVGHWGEGMIKRLASNGIIKGYPDGTYKPNAPVTRAELSKMITVAMAVSAVQKVENNPRLSTFVPAQELIDKIPNQDFQTKQELQTRLDVYQGKEQVAAVQTARNYLSFTSFSRSGLIDQLEYEGYSTEDATSAVDFINPDWYEQAAKSAQSYIDLMPFSRSGLIGQLEFEGFSHDQAVYGADFINVDWYEQAAKSAQSYIDLMPFSRQGLIDQLVYEGFSHDQAVYGVTKIGY